MTTTQRANIVGRLVVFSVTIPLIGLYSYVFKGRDHVKSWIDLYWPPDSPWVVCFVIGIILGEAVRRWMLRRER